jgi:phosphoserine/homoserine phosphotransferase
MRSPVIVCLDLEGVLVPEIWINVAMTTGIDDLKVTTREVPDYDALMTRRLAILDQHKLKLADIQAVIAGMGPLEGAPEFVAWVREHSQLIILSDTFYEFARPLMQRLNHPTLFCNQLEVDRDGRIVHYHLRQPNQKKHVVAALKTLNFRVLASGDAYNDTAMLGEAHAGFFFRPPEQVARQFPQFPVTHTYAELQEALWQAGPLSV